MPARMFLAKIVNVVDGDTFDADIDLGFFIHNLVRLRLKDVDTPEIRGETREAGLIVKEYVRQAIEGKEFWIGVYKLDKYGRYVAQVYPWGYGDERDMKSLSDDLIERGMAKKVEYD